jgi:hypothetical protein
MIDPFLLDTNRTTTYHHLHDTYSSLYTGMYLYSRRSVPGTGMLCQQTELRLESKTRLPHA